MWNRADKCVVQQQQQPWTEAAVTPGRPWHSSAFCKRFFVLFSVDATTFTGRSEKMIQYKQYKLRLSVFSSLRMRHLQNKTQWPANCLHASHLMFKQPSSVPMVQTSTSHHHNVNTPHARKINSKMIDGQIFNSSGKNQASTYYKYCINSFKFVCFLYCTSRSAASLDVTVK